MGKALIKWLGNAEGEALRDSTRDIRKSWLVIFTIDIRHILKTLDDQKILF